MELDFSDTTITLRLISRVFHSIGWIGTRQSRKLLSPLFPRETSEKDLQGWKLDQRDARTACRHADPEYQRHGLG